MSDFETMPVGTMEEIREIRLLTSKLINAQIIGDFGLMNRLVLQIKHFYAVHSEKYPV
jgi:hypothetical protein